MIRTSCSDPSGFSYPEARAHDLLIFAKMIKYEILKYSNLWFELKPPRNPYGPNNSPNPVYHHQKPTKHPLRVIILT